MKQVELFAYTILYIRYLKDLSIINVIGSLVLISMTRLMNRIISAFDRDGENITEEIKKTMKELLNKIIFVFQCLFYLQCLFLIIYHYNLNFKKDVCRWVYGYIFTNFIGEFTCEENNKLLLILLDLMVIFSQLELITERLTTFDSNHNKIIIFESLNIDRYGILSILMINTIMTDINDWDIVISTDNSNPTFNYESIR